MASIYYLLKTRKKHSFFSSLFFLVWAKRLYTFPELISFSFNSFILKIKGANISNTTEIGKACISGDFKFLQVGDNTFIGRANIALHETVCIGHNVCINDGVQILTASHDVYDPEWRQIKKSIIIEDYAWIATNAILLPGAHVGKGVVVGAGAIVAKRVPDNCIVIGNPLQILPKKRSNELRYNPCHFLSFNRAWLN